MGIPAANDITATVFAAQPVSPDLATLKADTTIGDGNGPPFQPWQFVRLLDGTQAAYDMAFGSWFAGAAPPSSPANQGEVIADLETLKLFIGTMSNSDDELLTDALAAASEWVYERTMRCDWPHPDVQTAILMLAARLYQRRRSPEGTSGFGGDGIVVRVLASDPDINRLLERHLELLTVGIG